MKTKQLSSRNLGLHRVAQAVGGFGAFVKLITFALGSKMVTSCATLCTLRGLPVVEVKTL